VLLQDLVERCSPKASKVHDQQKSVKILSYKKEKNDQLPKMKLYWQHSLLARIGYPLHQPHKMEQKPSMRKEDLLHICIETREIDNLKKYAETNFCIDPSSDSYITCHQLFQKLFSPFV